MLRYCHNTKAGINDMANSMTLRRPCAEMRMHPADLPRRYTKCSIDMTMVIKYFSCRSLVSATTSSDWGENWTLVNMSAKLGSMTQREVFLDSVNSPRFW